MTHSRAILLRVASWLLIGAALQWPVQWLIIAWVVKHPSNTRASSISSTPAWPLNPLPSELAVVTWPGAPDVSFDAAHVGYLRTYAYMFPQESKPSERMSMLVLDIGLPFRGLRMWEAHSVDLAVLEGRNAAARGRVFAPGPAWLWPKGTILPALPLWPGFALNTLVFAGVLAACWRGPRAIVRRLRQKRGGCPRCGYSRESLAADAACPECGVAPVGKEIRA